MLAVLSPDELRRAVASEDVKTLTGCPGIGQKGAQRIILELKDRIGAPTGGRAPPRAAVGRAVAGPGAQAWSAWAGRPRTPTRRSTPWRPRPGRRPDVGALLRAALRTLSKA